MKPRRFSRRTRDLLNSQPGANGKGSADRTTDDKAYRDGYDYWKKCEAEKRIQQQGSSYVQQPAAVFEGRTAVTCGADGETPLRITGGVTEGSQCFCDCDPCHCGSELDIPESAPETLSAVPPSRNSSVNRYRGVNKIR